MLTSQLFSPPTLVGNPKSSQLLLCETVSNNTLLRHLDNPGLNLSLQEKSCPGSHFLKHWKIPGSGTAVSGAGIGTGVPGSDTAILGAVSGTGTGAYGTAVSVLSQFTPVVDESETNCYFLFSWFCTVWCRGGGCVAC